MDRFFLQDKKYMKLKFAEALSKFIPDKKFIELHEVGMDIQVLISTMNQENPHSLAGAMAVNNYVLVNQVTKKEISVPKDTEDMSRKTLSFRDKGLSKSRNIATKNASADICVVADDDMYYVDDYENIITDAYLKYSDADIIAFSVDNDDASKDREPLKEGKVGLLYSMKISSVRITFKRASVINSGVWFNEEFGAGTDNYMGEENIFLTDCIRAGLKVYSVPIRIATLRESESTWFRGYDKQYFMTKGKVYRKMFPVLFPFLILRFALRKRFLYKDTTGLIVATADMFKGALSSSAPVRHRAEQG